ncbi:MAG: hypothetical protein IKD86_02965 [Firmicutes bacterium]|nr:hypothetical protein [Bacillota bacterium]
MRDNKLESRQVVLAFDTSAYTTSAAAVDRDGKIITDQRRLLDVKKGDRGLRQSQAFFQHMAVLPELTEAACRELRRESFEISAISVSSRPRPERNSYMPVFMAGLRTGECIAASLGVPLYRFSHQEGHIAAAAGVLAKGRKTLAFHLSGGTSELLLLDGCRPEKIIGGSKDLSYGQLIDRTGVAYGLSFPAGKEMDREAVRGQSRLKSHFSRRGHRVYDEAVLSRIHVEGTELNLSGIERSCLEAAEQGIPVEITAAELFLRIADSITEVVHAASARENVTDVVLAGGVASSRFLRQRITGDLAEKGIRALFGSPGLSSDNAVGTARLGMDAFLKTAG